VTSPSHGANRAGVHVDDTDLEEALDEACVDTQRTTMSWTLLLPPLVRRPLRGRRPVRSKPVLARRAAASSSRMQASRAAHRAARS
jgi:hypothetical protein